MILKLEGIEESIEIEPGEANELVIENTKLFYNLSKSIQNLDEEYFTLYDLKVLNNSKYILVITDLFNLNPNSKKNINFKL